MSKSTEKEAKSTAQKEAPKKKGLKWVEEKNPAKAMEAYNEGKLVRKVKRGMSYTYLIAN